MCCVRTVSGKGCRPERPAPPQESSMTQTGPDVQPPAPPGHPYQAWAPGEQHPGAPAQPPARSGAKKWVSLAGTVVVAGGVAAFQLTGGFGASDPSVGDCVQMQ